MRYGTKMAGERYATKARRNYHAAHVDFPLRMYICGCAPSFALPNGRTGPNGYPRRKEFTLRRPKKWNSKQNNIYHYFRRLEKNA